MDVATTGTPSVTLTWGESATVSASTLAFGPVTQGAVSPTRTLTVTNTGPDPLSGFTFAGTNPDDFFVSADTCRSVAVGGTCSVSLRFAPQAPGQRAATFNVAGTTVSLTGIGTAPLAGANGATGPAGAAGPTGPAGPAGARGPAGKVELVTCTKKKVGAHTKTTCKAKLVSGPVKFTTTKATLARAGRVVATGSVRRAGRQLTIVVTHRLARGRYTLRYGHHRETVTIGA
jgi:hypothetical protein